MSPSWSSDPLFQRWDRWYWRFYRASSAVGVISVGLIAWLAWRGELGRLWLVPILLPWVPYAAWRWVARRRFARMDAILAGKRRA